MQNVGKRVESQNSQTSQTNPDPAKDQGHKGRRDGEEVNKGVELEHEDKLVIGGDESHEEVGHEKHVEEEVKLHNALHVSILQSRPVVSNLQRYRKIEEAFLQQSLLSINKVGELGTDADHKDDPIQKFSSLKS